MFGKCHPVLHQTDQVGAARYKGEMGVLSMRSDRRRNVAWPRKCEWMHGLTPSRCIGDSCDDVGVTRAPTEIATHTLANLWRRQVLNCEWLSDVFCRRTRPARF